MQKLRPWRCLPLILLPLTSCAGAPVVVREPIPTELLAPTLRPVIEYPYKPDTAGHALIDYDDRLGACNADKAAIRGLMSRVGK